MNDHQRYLITQRIEELERNISNLQLERQAIDKAMYDLMEEMKSLKEGL